MAKKKRQRRITVLCIPDDNAEPYSFVLSWTIARIALVIASVLSLHLIFGVVGYVQYFKLRSKNQELEKSNTRLLEDNKRVYRLASWFEELDKDQGKIMSLLGIDNRSAARPAAETPMTAGSQLTEHSYASNHAPPSDQVDLTMANLANSGGSRVFLTKTQNGSKAPPNLPTVLPVEGFLSKNYARSPWYPFSAHPGIDIAGKQGAVVVAAGDGQVVYSGWHNELGNLIIIYHGDDIFSYYGHNERLLARDRVFVKRGDPIALRGNSGRSSGPHLHFEIWQNGKPVDPREFILEFKYASR